MVEGNKNREACGSASLTKREKDLVHRRFGHPNHKALEIIEELTEDPLNGMKAQCSSCAEAKAHRKPARKEYQGDEERRSHTVYIDVMGPYGGIRPSHVVPSMSPS